MAMRTMERDLEPTETKNMRKTKSEEMRQYGLTGNERMGFTERRLRIDGQGDCRHKIVQRKMGLSG